MINPQWLELSMFRMNFHGPKDIRVTEVRLYFGKDEKLLLSPLFHNIFYMLLDFHV